jgi:hypothetical protein
MIKKKRRAKTTRGSEQFQIFFFVPFVPFVVKNYFTGIPYTSTSV